MVDAIIQNILHKAEALEPDSLAALGALSYKGLQLNDLFRIHVQRAQVLNLALRSGKALNPEDDAAQIILKALTKNDLAAFERAMLDGNLVWQRHEMERALQRITQAWLQPLLMIAEGARLLRVLNA